MRRQNGQAAIKQTNPTLIPPRKLSDKEHGSLEEILPKYEDLLTDIEYTNCEIVLRDMWQTRNDNRVIQQNHNIKVSETHLAIKQLHEKLDRISNKHMKKINAMRDELHERIDHELRKGMQRAEKNRAFDEMVKKHTAAHHLRERGRY